MGSPTVRCTTTSGEAHCALAARSPSQAAASPPWPRSSIRSTSSVPSASSSSTRAPSRSRTTSLTVRTASSSSSARHPSWPPLPWPSHPPSPRNCYCDPEALPRGEGANLIETGTRVLGWCRMARGPTLLSPARASGLSSTCSPLPGCRLFILPGRVSPPTRLAMPAPDTGAISYSCFGSGARGKGRQGLMGSFFYPSYPVPT